MKDIEREADAILEQARQGFTPSRADAERVLAKLGPLILQRSELDGDEQIDSTRPSSVASLSAPAWLGRALATALIAAGFGSGGYWLGFRAGARQAPVARPAEVPAVVAANPSPVPSLLPVEVTSQLAQDQAENTPAKRRPARASSTTATRSADSALVDSRDTLQEEVETLRRVERAQRQHNPRLALSLLSELDLLVPRGKLMEERFAAATIARCELALAPSDQLLSAFLQRYARSAYAERVSLACSNSQEGK